jgi:hypothetical protein
MEALGWSGDLVAAVLSDDFAAVQNAASHGTQAEAFRRQSVCDGTSMTMATSPALCNVALPVTIKPPLIVE